ncbi:MAG: hypothetical protein ACYCV7_03245 [Acidimicrobiales bacterium]
MLVSLGIPSIPAVACPVAAGALGAIGLAPLCQAAGGLAGAAAAQVAGFGITSVLDAIAGWVSAGGVWLLGQIGIVMSATTSVGIGASWFTSHYRTMAGLAGVVIVPLLLLGVVQSVHRQSASMLIRSVLVNVPLAILLTAVAVKLVQLGLALTDSLSATVAQGAGLETGHFFQSTIVALSDPATGGPATPTFVVLLGGLAVVFGAFLLWVELLIRAAAVYVAVLFLPLALASLAWPAISHWCRRLVDTLVALVLGKFVIVSVLSLAAGALAGGTGSAAAGSSGGGAGNHGGFADVLGGAALLGLAAFAPWALFRLLPFLEAGAVGHLEGAGHRAYHAATGPPKSLAQTAMSIAGGGAGVGTNEVGRAMLNSRSATGAGSATGVAGSAAGSAAGMAGSPTGSAGGSSAPAGPPVAGPDLGPSSVERTGVGTAAPPGAGVPTHPVNGPAGAAFTSVVREAGLYDEAFPGGRIGVGSSRALTGSDADHPHRPKP